MGDRAEREAFVTLATNDTYALGCLVLGNSLRRTNTQRKLVIMVTDGVTPSMRNQLSRVFDLIHQVDLLDSRDSANLALLGRPDLSCTFTKLHCWRLTQFDKAVFLDADTLVLQGVDELFDREELSASPDAGWPDCFNSGVFVYKPSEETYNALREFALSHGSFDGGDQGLLNLFFRDWATKDIARHLPFIYNVVSQAFYSYLPAFTEFKNNIKIVHFIGEVKPWHHAYNTTTGRVQLLPQSGHNQDFLQLWWDIFMSNVQAALDPALGGLVGELASLQIRSGGPSVVFVDDTDRKLAWERGQMDYMGIDSFDNIKRKLDSKITERSPSPPRQVQSVPSPNSSNVEFVIGSGEDNAIAALDTSTYAQEIIDSAIATVVSESKSTPPMSDIAESTTLSLSNLDSGLTVQSDDTSAQQAEPSTESTLNISADVSVATPQFQADTSAASETESETFSVPSESATFSLPSESTDESATFSLPSESATFSLPSESTGDSATFSLPSESATDSATFSLPSESAMESATFSLPSDSATFSLPSESATDAATFTLPSNTSNESSFTVQADTSEESATFSLPAMDSSADASVTIQTEAATIPAKTQPLESKPSAFSKFGNSKSTSSKEPKQSSTDSKPVVKTSPFGKTAVEESKASAFGKVGKAAVPEPKTPGQPPKSSLFGKASVPEPKSAPAPEPKSSGVPGKIQIPGKAPVPDPKPSTVPGKFNIPGKAPVPEPKPSTVPGKINIPGKASVPDPKASTAPGKVNIAGKAPVPEPKPSTLLGKAAVPAPEPKPSTVPGKAPEPKPSVKTSPFGTVGKGWSPKSATEEKPSAAPWMSKSGAGLKSAGTGDKAAAGPPVAAKPSPVGKPVGAPPAGTKPATPEAAKPPGGVAASPASTAPKLPGRGSILNRWNPK